MFFKHRHLAALAALALLVSSCVPKVGEDPPPTQGQELNDTKCLSEATEVALAFVKGEARTSQIAPAWDCFAGAFRAFHKYVRGRDRDSYTPAELAKFFEDNFFEKDAGGDVKGRISPELQAEFMKFKQIFVGGSRDRVTRDEVLAVIDVTGPLARICERVNPYMKVFLMTWVPDESSRKSGGAGYFEEANGAIQEAARELGALVKSTHEPYLLDDTVAFVQSLSDFFGQNWEVTEEIRRFLPVAKKIKKALAGGLEESVLPEEWRRILILGSRAYMQFLRYHYFLSESSEETSSTRLDYIARTFEDTFSIFEELVREKPGGQVSRAEVDGIAEALTRAWPEFKTSDLLWDELMKVKQVLVGGSREGFAVSDFENARLKVGFVKTVVLRLLPYMKVYTGEWKPDSMERNEALALHDQAMKVLESSVRELGSRFEASYDVNDIGVLLREFERLYPPEKPEDGLAGPVQTHLPLLLEVKATLYGQVTPIVTKEQWSGLLSLAARAYSSFTFYEKFLRDRDDRELTTYDSLGRLVDQALNLIRDVIAAKTSGRVSREEVSRIVLEMRRLGWIPKDIDPSTLEGLIKVLLNRVLVPPEKRLVGEKPDGIRATTIEYVRKEFKIWLQSQMFMTRAFDGSAKLRIRPDELREKVADGLRNPGSSNELKIGLNEFKVILATPVPFTLDTVGRLRIAPQADYWYNLPSLERHNLVRLVTRLFVASYAAEMSRIRDFRGVTSEEAQRAFREFRPLALDLGFLEPKDTAFMTSRLREANIFMPRSDGNQMASYAEIHDLASTILSGLKLDNQLRPGLVKECRITRARGDGSRVKYECMYRNYQRSFRTYLTSMPAFQSYQKAMTNDVFNFFMYNSLKGAGYIPNPENAVLLTDITLLPPLLQYIELIYARFDINADGIITVPEAKRAYPAFKPLFVELAKKELEDGTLKEEDLWALFTWVLKNGRPPSGVWEGLRFLNWKNAPDSWVLAADRTKIAEILGFVGDQLNTP